MNVKDIENIKKLIFKNTHIVRYKNYLHKRIINTRHSKRKITLEMLYTGGKNISDVPR